jgi:hypothetical protein
MRSRNFSLVNHAASGDVRGYSSGDVQDTTAMVEREEQECGWSEQPQHPSERKSERKSIASHRIQQRKASRGSIICFLMSAITANISIVEQRHLIPFRIVHSSALYRPRSDHEG